MTSLTPEQLHEARRQMASAAGQKSMAIRTPEQRRALGQRAARTRWDKELATKLGKEKGQP